MISIILFLFGYLATLALNLCLFWTHARQIALTEFIAVACVVAANGLVATIVCKVLPNNLFRGKLFDVGNGECRFYDMLKIKKWKALTLELGALNGFRKNKLACPSNEEYLQRFILENNKGSLTHLFSLFIPPALIFALPQPLWLPMGLPIFLTNFILNAMPLAILRYNSPRLRTSLRFAGRKKKD